MNSDICLRMLHVTLHSKAVRIPKSFATFSCSNLSERLCRNLEDSNVQEHVGSKGTICCLLVHSILDCHQFGLSVWLVFKHAICKRNEGCLHFKPRFFFSSRAPRRNCNHTEHRRPPSSPSLTACSRPKSGEERRQPQVEKKLGIQITIRDWAILPISYLREVVLSPSETPTPQEVLERNSGHHTSSSLKRISVQQSAESQGEEGRVSSIFTLQKRIYMQARPGARESCLLLPLSLQAGSFAPLPVP